MPRTRPAHRFDDLIEAATWVFAEWGYRRTQIADVARQSGVAAGTVYLYVQSKEALFYLVLRRQLLPDRPPARRLPARTPQDREILDFLGRRLALESKVPALEAALAGPRPADPAAELSSIVRQIYALIQRHRVTIRILERSAPDWPELFDLFYRKIRRPFVERIGRYLDARIAMGTLAPLPDVPTASRLVIETIAWFAMHRKFGPDNESLDDVMAERTVVHLLTAAFLPRGSR